MQTMMMAFAAYNQTVENDYRDPFTNYESSQQYADEIEEATEDRLRCWLLSDGLTSEEIDDLLEEGLNIRDIADDYSLNRAEKPFSG